MVTLVATCGEYSTSFLPLNGPTATAMSLAGMPAAGAPREFSVLKVEYTAASTSGSTKRANLTSLSAVRAVTVVVSATYRSPSLKRMSCVTRTSALAPSHTSRRSNREHA